MTKRTKQRNIIIIGLSCIVLLMVVGYAAFQSVLNINGTSNISSTWDVQITGITKDKTKGNVTEITEPTFDKESATFNVGLELPGDYIYYKIAVTNKGTLAAIAKLGNLSCGDSNAIKCGAYADSNVTDIGTNTDLTAKRLIIGPNETEYYNVWVKYNGDVTEQPEKTTSAIKLELTYEQSDVGITHQTEDKCYTGKVLENGTLSITDYNESCGTDVIIPDTIDGYTVTEIQDGTWDTVLQKSISPFSGKGITSVIIPDTMIKIGVKAFAENKIETLQLGNNVTRINSEAFSNNRLTSVVFPDSLTIIGEGSFGNNKLTSINLPKALKSMSGGAFSNNNLPAENALVYGINSDGTTNYKVLNSYASSKAENFIIPDTITSIYQWSFRGVAMDKITIPQNVIEIGYQAFSSTNLKEVIFTEGIKTIGSWSFAGTSITSLVLPNSLVTLSVDSFASTKLTSVSIGTGIKNIAESAFKNTPNLTSITINRKDGAISGSPWGATKATVNWTGTN